MSKKLYHGSNVIVEHPDIRIRGYEKDFGYLHTEGNGLHKVSVALFHLKNSNGNEEYLFS